MRLGLFLLFIVSVIVLLWARFPYMVDSQNTVLQIGYLLFILAMLMGSMKGAKHAPLGKLAREALLWVVILLSLVAAYAYRGEIMESRVAREIIPHRPVAVKGGRVELHADVDGHFYAEGYVNGTPIRFIVDTGATDIVISKEDAERLGLPMLSLNYTRRYQTASGIVRGAVVTLDYISVGSIRIDKVQASVNEGDMRQSLLGMAFLKRLRGFRVEENTLTLLP